jgi:hypothetical protein
MEYTGWCILERRIRNVMGNENNRLQQIVPHVQTREIMGMWTTKNMAKADNPLLEHIEKTSE